MERIFLPGITADSGHLVLPKDKAHYLIRVHRLKTGDAVAVFDGCANEFVARLKDVQREKDRVVLAVERLLRTEPEAVPQITLCQGLAKQGKVETVIQKACELGVHAIRPFSSSYAVVQVKEGRTRKRLSRWEKVAQEACRQSGRIRLPEIAEPCSFEDLLKDDAGLRLLAYEGSDVEPLGDLLVSTPPERVSLIVGPEGGFAPEEIVLARESGVRIVSMGPRVLRTETAGVALLAVVQYTWGDLKGDRPPYRLEG